MEEEDEFDPTRVEIPMPVGFGDYPKDDIDLLSRAWDPIPDGATGPAKTGMDWPLMKKLRWLLENEPSCIAPPGKIFLPHPQLIYREGILLTDAVLGTYLIAREKTLEAAHFRHKYLPGTKILPKGSTGMSELHINYELRNQLNEKTLSEFRAIIDYEKKAKAMYKSPYKTGDTSDDDSAMDEEAEPKAKKKVDQCGNQFSSEDSEGDLAEDSEFQNIIKRNRELALEQGLKAKAVRDKARKEQEIKMETSGSDADLNRTEKEEEILNASTKSLPTPDTSADSLDKKPIRGPKVRSTRRRITEESPSGDVHEAATPSFFQKILLIYNRPVVKVIRILIMVLATLAHMTKLIYDLHKFYIS